MILFSPYLKDILYLFQEYEEDGVDWTKVNFEDNQECLDLFEKVVSVVLPPELSIVCKCVSYSDYRTALLTYFFVIVL